MSTIADVANSQALPNTAQMKLRPSAVPAKRTRLNIQPYQYPTGDITTNQLIQFFIPARRSTMYDPHTLYLRGTITGVTTTTDGKQRLNRNAFSVINRLVVNGQGSVMLEDIQNYNDLCHILTDIQMTREDKRGLSTMYGSSDDTATIDDGVVFANDAATLDFCIPIVSSFGLLADTLIPTGWLNSDLRFDLYTELPNVAFRSHAADNSGPEAVTAYRLTNLELVVDQIEFDALGMEAVSQFAPASGPLYLHASTWSSYTSTLQNGSIGFFSQLLPHRSLSVKQVLSAAHIATANGFDSFARVLPYGSSNLQVGLNIGGVKHPQKAIGNTAELFAELQKSQHALNQLVLNGSISRTEYNKYLASNSSVANSRTCKAVIGFDTEIYDKKGTTIINGQNWTGLNVFAEGFVARNAAGEALNANLTMNHFVNYDVIYVIQDGIISSRF